MQLNAHPVVEEEVWPTRWRTSGQKGAGGVFFICQDAGSVNLLPRICKASGESLVSGRCHRRQIACAYGWKAVRRVALGEIPRCGKGWLAAGKRDGSLGWAEALF